MRPLIVFLIALLLGAVGGCNVEPQAPQGTVYALSVNPAEIALGESAVITVIALHDSGVPARAGTEFFVTTDMGLVPAVVRTDDRGIARATLTTEGLQRGGFANVAVQSGLARPLGVSSVRIKILAPAVRVGKR